MITNANYDISEIEGSLFGAMKAANVCPIIYPNRRPSTTSVDADSFVVVKSVTEVVDKTAFGKSICRLDIYVKSKIGIKDVAEMSKIVKKIFLALPIQTQRYTFSYLSNLSLGLDNTGYDVEAVNINVLIK